MNPTIHIILSYCKSHIYELHNIIGAVITFAIMQLAKKPIKNYSAERFEDEPDKQRRFNTVIVLMTMVVGIAVFFVLSLVSPMIEFKTFSAVITGCCALVLYAFLDGIGLIPSGR